MHALFIQKSSNRKTGPIPTTYTERKSCPPSCPHIKKDCYAEDFHTRLAWNRAPEGLDWASLCDRVASLPDEQIWRHNVGGDLPGEGEKVDAAKLGELVRANFGRRGFTYSHKKTPEAIKWIRHANQWGFYRKPERRRCGRGRPTRRDQRRAGGLHCANEHPDAEHDARRAPDCCMSCPGAGNHLRGLPIVPAPRPRGNRRVFAHMEPERQRPTPERAE